MDSSQTGLLVNVTLIAAYLVLNSSLNILMKWSLGIYGAPPCWLTMSRWLVRWPRQRDGSARDALYRRTSTLMPTISRVCCTGFTFPLFLTVGHMLFSFSCLAPIMAFEPFVSKHHATLRKQWKGLACIGAFMALNIALNNLSLVHITLSLNQVIRCAGLFPNFLLQSHAHTGGLFDHRCTNMVPQVLHSGGDSAACDCRGEQSAD